MLHLQTVVLLAQLLRGLCRLWAGVKEDGAEAGVLMVMWS